MSIQTNARRQFLEDYRRIRYAEGRGSEDPAYYRALPFEDLSGRNTAMWAMRARTYRYFESKVLAPIERAALRPLDILDLGAGNAWMSYRLALRNHRPVALDIFSDPRDGLLAARNYAEPFPCIEAEFDHLPFPSESFDVAIFNSSLHYSTDYIRTLSETLRCLRPSGTLVILDSPVYRRREHGEAMVAARHADFEKRYGFRSDAIPSIEFLDTATLNALADRLHLRWRIYKPWYGWQWHLRPWKARLDRRRPPSNFWILTAAVNA
jgi:SAM-dependent methyltransferase